MGEGSGGERKGQDYARGGGADEKVGVEGVDDNGDVTSKPPVP